jgi:hypothetical protein
VREVQWSRPLCGLRRVIEISPLDAVIVSAWLGLRDFCLGGFGFLQGGGGFADAGPPRGNDGGE